MEQAVVERLKETEKKIIECSGLSVSKKEIEIFDVYLND